MTTHETTEVDQLREGDRVTVSHRVFDDDPIEHVPAVINTIAHRQMLVVEEMPDGAVLAPRMWAAPTDENGWPVRNSTGNLLQLERRP